MQSLSEIAARSVSGPAGVAREVHTAVTGRVFRLLGPLGWPTRVIHDRVSHVSYRSVDAALGAPLRAGGRALVARASPDADSLADSLGGALALGALNGIAGDRLARDHPDLALELTVRRGGRDVALDADSLREAFPDATEKLVVFVHGLCGTDDGWRWAAPGAGETGRRPYGARLRDELGYTPIYVRYNTGLHISDNGRRLAAVLERLTAEWPVEVGEMALIGHSMGGLVARSACRYGELEDRAWTDRTRNVFCLGTPHLGAPLEKAANVASWPLNRLPETRPFADLFFNRRSAGIKDLRFGSCAEEDWCECEDPDEFLSDRCTEVPFLPGATYYFVGATLTRRPDGLGSLAGDLLVRYPSASGAGRRRRIPFEIGNGRHIGGLDHMRLLNNPAVYAQIRDWLARPPAELATPSA
jgi:pimeloyl-ACP methyl ester carboxylesterase